MPQNKTKNSDQTGNVFILILAGIFLFGALMFTFTRGASKGVNSLSKHEARIAAQEILNYAQALEQAVNRVRRNGCSENEISFENNIVAGYTNSSSPVDNSCHIFDDNGGKVIYQKFDSTWLDSSFSAQVNYQNSYFSGGSNITNIGAINTELLFSIFYLNRNICESINDQLGVSNPPSSDNATSDMFTGDYTPSSTPEIGDEATNLIGQPTFCFFHSGSSAYFFVHTLLAR